MSAHTPDTPTHDVRVLAVVGPTGVGKTALAEELAVRLTGEIVSADSMQIYRGMDIGTAKPPVAQRRTAYHCVDLVNPGESFSAALYQEYARRAIGDCAARGTLPILCGGTGLYVRAALDDLEFPPGEQVDNVARDRYERIAERDGAGALHAVLAERDPRSAALIHANNVRRVVRALEMLDGGISYADHASHLSERTSVYDALMLGVTMSRSRLYEQIDARVDAMIAAGLLAEVARLLSEGFRGALTSAQAIGYKELVPVIEGEADLDTAIAAIKQATRRYAKRQLTWFRADPRVVWIDVTNLSLAEQAEASLAALHLTGT